MVRQAVLREMWGKVADADAATGCREWLGATRAAHGIPVFYRRGKEVSVRRAFYTAYVGPTRRWRVKTTCGNEACVAVPHLELRAPKPPEQKAKDGGAGLRCDEMFQSTEPRASRRICSRCRRITPGDSDVTFTEAERETWDKNLHDLIVRIDGSRAAKELW